MLVKDDLMGMETSPSVNVNFCERKGCLRQSSAEGRLAGSRMNINAKNSLNNLCSLLYVA